MAASAGASEAAARVPDIGDSVLIAGLTSAEGAALNGQFGIVTKQLNDKGRVEVSVAGTFLRLLPVNARKLAFDIGARVEARGYDSEAGGALGGRSGTVLGYAIETDRFQVYFARGGTAKLKAANLSLAGPSALPRRTPPNEGPVAPNAAGARAAAEDGAGAAASGEAVTTAPAAEEPAQATRAGKAAAATLPAERARTAAKKGRGEACQAPAAAATEAEAPTSASPAMKRPGSQGGKPGDSVDGAAPEAKPPAKRGRKAEAKKPDTKSVAEPDAKAEAKPPANAQEAASPEPEPKGTAKATPPAKQGRKPAAGRPSPTTPVTKQKHVAEEKAQTLAAVEALAKKEVRARPAKAAATEVEAPTSAPPAMKRPRGQGGKPGGSVDGAEPEVQAKAAPEAKPPAKRGRKAEAKKPDTKSEAEPDAKAKAAPEAKPPAKRERKAEAKKPDTKSVAEPDAKAEAKPPANAQEAASPEQEPVAISKATPPAKQGRKLAAGRPPTTPATKPKCVAEEKAQTPAAVEAPAKKQPRVRPANAKTDGSTSSARGERGAAPPAGGAGEPGAAETLEGSEAFKKAVRMGLEGALRKLASRDELSGRGIGPDQLLEALLAADGLVNKAEVMPPEA